MRIVGGRLRGLKLAEIGAGDSAAHLRPTTDRVREAVFNLIENSHGVALDGARVPAKRSSTRVAFVDDGATARALLRANVEKARAMGATDIWRRNATDLGPNRGAGYDVVFLDPPYGQRLGEAALASALTGGWLAPGALVVWEEDTAPLPPPGLSQVDQRRYGGTLVTLLRAAGASGGNI